MGIHENIVASSGAIILDLLDLDTLLGMLRRELASAVLSDFNVVTMTCTEEECGIVEEIRDRLR